MNVRYRVTLGASERAQLATMVLGGKGAYRRLKWAHILLAADSGVADKDIARNVSVGTSTVYRTKQRFVEEGLERALSELPRAGAERKFGVSDESLLVAVACSDPPEGRSRWTLQLLADEMVRLTEHESVSDETIRRRLGEVRGDLSAATAAVEPRVDCGGPSTSEGASTTELWSLDREKTRALVKAF